MFGPVTNSECISPTFYLLRDVVVIHLAVLFGWTGIPLAFQVLTRTLQALCRHIICGLGSVSQSIDSTITLVSLIPTFNSS